MPCCVLHRSAFPVVSEWYQNYANITSQFVCQASRNLHASDPSANDALDRVAGCNPIVGTPHSRGMPFGTMYAQTY
jgi:hypothetical protein